jgi:hypothetical protein
MILQAEAGHKSFVAAYDDHDKQIGDHHNVNQREHDEHDERFVELRGGEHDLAGSVNDRLASGVKDWRDFIANRFDELPEGFLVAKDCLHKVYEFYPKMKHIHRLGHDKADIERHLQPAAPEYEVG